MSQVALSVAEVSAVLSGVFVRVELGSWRQLADGVHARSAWVGRVDGRLVAYANQCMHHPVELDAPPDAAPRPRGEATLRLAPVSDDGDRLSCLSHGAEFRRSDGFCVVGPCAGQRLVPIVVTGDRGGIALEISQFGMK